MDLPPVLLASAHGGPRSDPGLTYHTEEDYAAILLAGHPVGRDARLFAYGSLIWRPEVEHSLPRVSRCCTQAMMGSAHVVPK